MLLTVMIAYRCSIFEGHPFVRNIRLGRSYITNLLEVSISSLPFIFLIPRNKKFYCAKIMFVENVMQFWDSNYCIVDKQE